MLRSRPVAAVLMILAPVFALCVRWWTVMAVLVLRAKGSPRAFARGLAGKRQPTTFGSSLRFADHLTRALMIVVKMSRFAVLASISASIRLLWKIVMRRCAS